MHRTSRHPVAAAFTLIEMLAVIGILLIVLAIAVPAFQSLGQATALASAGNATANNIGTARQNSTSRNVLTAVVVLTGTGTEADYRTLGIFECGVTGSWLQIGKWEPFPTGIAFDPQDRTNCSFLDHSPAMPRLLDGAGNSSIRYAGKPVPPTAFACRVFVPTGSLTNPEFPAQLRLVEGTLQGLGSNTIQYARRNNSTAVNYYDIAIVGATGATKISRP